MWVSRLLAVLGVAAGIGVAAGFATSAPPPITPAAAATSPADASCGGLITVVCGSESRNESYGGTNSNNGDSRQGSSSASQSVNQSGEGSSHGSRAHRDHHDEGDPEVTGCR
jgi:hypothetical protein